MTAPLRNNIIQTTIKELDSVLEYLSINNIGVDGILFSELLENFTPKVTDEIMTRHLAKLRQDGLIFHSKITDTINITHDGAIKYLLGGYTQEIKEKSDEIMRIRELETYPKVLNRLTFWVVLGTIGLLTIEFVKLLNDIYHWWE